MRFYILITILLILGKGTFCQKNIINHNTANKVTYSNSKILSFQADSQTVTLYTAQRNETLKELAGRPDIYNNMFAWSVLYKANRHMIKNHKMKLSGLTLKIPVLSPEEKLKYDKIRERYFKNYFPRTLKRLLKKSKQFLIVTSNGWDSTNAIMKFFEKKKNKLLKASDSIHVNLGRSGLGWGNGLINFNTFSGPVKHEGDGKSPAGIFSLSYVFGYLPKDSVKWLRYPYKQVTKKIECVDDTTSIYYNTLVNDDKINKTWNSSEIMQREDVLYKYGIFIDHNSNPQIPGCGSCIFIHIQEGPGIPTSGCTSLPEDQIVKLLHWLNAKDKPLLIQLPEKEFDRIKSIIGL